MDDGQYPDHLRFDTIDDSVFAEQQLSDIFPAGFWDLATEQGEILEMEGRFGQCEDKGTGLRFVILRYVLEYLVKVPGSSSGPTYVHDVPRSCLSRPETLDDFVVLKNSSHLHVIESRFDVGSNVQFVHDFVPGDFVRQSVNCRFCLLLGGLHDSSSVVHHQSVNPSLHAVNLGPSVRSSLDESINRDTVSLDLFRPLNESLEDSANLSPPHVVAQ